MLRNRIICVRLARRSGLMSYACLSNSLVCLLVISDQRTMLYCSATNRIRIDHTHPYPARWCDVWRSRSNRLSPSSRSTETVVSDTIAPVRTAESVSIASSRGRPYDGALISATRADAVSAACRYARSWPTTTRARARVDTANSTWWLIWLTL